MSRKRNRRCARAGVALFVATAASSPALASDPTMSECLAANESAIRLRDDHKLREARDQSLVCAKATCPGEVREACQGRVAKLNASIPTLVFEAKDTLGNDLTRVAVTMDGAPFADHLDGTAIAVDPGEHTFLFTIPGQRSLEKHLVVYQGEINRRERVQIAAASVVPKPAEPASPLSPPPPGKASHLGLQRELGLVAGGAGIVGVGVGSIFGLLASSAWSSVKSACGAGGPAACAASSRSSVESDQSKAQTDGTISTVAFIAGGALVATGLVVFFTGGRPSPEATSSSSGSLSSVSPSPVFLAPSVGPGFSGFALRGGF